MQTDATSDDESPIFAGGNAENAPADENEFDDENIELCTNAETTRIGRWKNHLLDLSLRNSLLNFDRRGAGAGLNLAVHDAAAFEDVLADRSSVFQIFAPEELAAARGIDANSGVPEDDARALAAAAERAFPRKRLIALPPPALKSKNASAAERVQDRLARIARDTKKAMEETGANTLCVAIGFLRWPCEKRRAAQLRAPLILVPVRLARANRTARFSLSVPDEDTRLNMTLVELLRQEFGIVPEGLGNSLPEDESGVDVRAVFRIFREAVAGHAGFAVEETVGIGNFSFAKYLMWRDLEERAAALARSRIVGHLIDETRKPFERETAFPLPASLDASVPAGTVFCPLSADSSQLAAVCAAAAGKNFILVGPPGTGKSQTIANMIANALAGGKTVLFVAEKAAALNVVFNRLKKIGLGDFCLELHSDKTDKREAYRQFSEALELAAAGTAHPAEKTRTKIAANAQALRETFMRRAKALHEPRGNGLTLAEAVGTVCANEGEIRLDFVWEKPLADTEAMRERKRAAAEELGTAFPETRGSLARAAGAIALENWSAAWQRNAEKTLRNFENAARTLGEKSADWTAASGLLPAAGTVKALGKLLKLARTLVGIRGENAALVLGADAKATLEKLRAAATLAENCARHKSLLSLPYSDDAPENARLDELLRTWNEAEISWALPRFFKRRKVVKTLASLASPNANAAGTDAAQKSGKRVPADPRVDLGNLIAIRASRKEFAEKFAALETAFPQLVHGLEPCGALPRIDALEKARAATETAFAQLESVPEKRDAWASVFSEILDGRNADFAPGGNAEKALSAAENALSDFSEKCAALREILGIADAPLPAAATESPDSARAFAEELLADAEVWRDVCAWNAAARAAARRGLGALADAVRSKKIPAARSREIFEINYCRLWTEAVLDAEPELAETSAGKNLSLLEKLRAADKTLRNLSAETARERLIERSRAVFNADAADEMKILRHEIGKRMRFLPIRRFLARAPRVSRLLKPCMLTSPLSAAQYLDARAEPFDLVIFDEASQIAVWDAVGALARGRSAVVVGDPKQLPPTGFFQRTFSGDDAGTTDESAPEDAESVLDECKACGVPAMNLSWHYRSRAESLIAFSNAHYYGGNLATFPAPRVRDRAVECVFCENGNYGGGTNPNEARALVGRIVSELSAPNFEWNEYTSVGVVTFNAQQQALILKLLDGERERLPQIRKFFSEEEVAEPLFVKNLENVQGDERGVIYFSTTFGPDGRGIVNQNFGPINRAGGERRLNVAITRARAGMRVFTSMRPSDIRAGRGGPADLRAFLEFARSGTQIAAEPASEKKSAGTHSAGTPGAEAAIAADLEALGWKCARDVGVSGIRVDIAVVHPDNDEEFLAGILCDGAASLNAPTVRDREILREDVLRGLGWHLLRAWTLVRLQTPKLCASRLDARLHKFLEDSRAAAAAESAGGVPANPEAPALAETNSEAASDANSRVPEAAE